jgi:sortase A
MARTHRPLRITVILLFTLSISALGVLHSNNTQSVASPAMQVRTVPLITSTTAPPTTTTLPKVDEPRLKSGAIKPKASYAPEPIVRIGEMEIPKIGLSTPIYHGITLRNIDNGPSHWPGTAMPGAVGNAVFAGHRTTHSKPFRNIDQLVPGDQVIYTINGVRSVYAVTGHEIVTPDALWIADQTPTATATIFGCHPPGSARYRYVVRMALMVPQP